MTACSRVAATVVLLGVVSVAAAAPRTGNQTPKASGSYTVVPPYTGSRTVADDVCAVPETTVVCEEDADAGSAWGWLASSAVAREDVTGLAAPFQNVGTAVAIAELSSRLRRPHSTTARLTLTVHYWIYGAFAALNEAPHPFTPGSEAMAWLEISAAPCLTCAPVTIRQTLATDDGVAMEGPGSATFTLAAPAGSWSTDVPVIALLGTKGVLGYDSAPPRRAEAAAHVEIEKIEVRFD